MTADNKLYNSNCKHKVIWLQRKNKCLKYHSLLLVVWEKYKKTTKTNLYKYNRDTI